MKPLNKSAEKVFRSAIAKLGEGTHVKIDNSEGTYMPLVVERIGSVAFASTPDKPFKLYSFAHYGEQNGDAMRDPDVVMLDSPAGLFPVSFRNDYVGVDNEALGYDANGNITGFRNRMQADIVSFCNTWAKNLKDQQDL